jgi:hypothetical protein
MNMKQLTTVLLDWLTTSEIKEDLEWTFKLYALTLALPLALTIMNVLFVGIIGFETPLGFLMNFKAIWIDYYFTGSLLNIDAWRWQLGLLFCSFLITKLN